MKVFINKFRRKIYNLIERIRMSEYDFNSMKFQSQMYTDMMKEVHVSIDTQYQTATNRNDEVLLSFPSSRTAIVTIDIKQMLANGGFEFNDETKFDVK